MANTDLNDALNNLGRTIGSIDVKVNAAKATARTYKDMIIQKLKDVVVQLNTLKGSDAFRNIGFIKQQLEESQTALTTRTQELADSKYALDASNKEMLTIKEQLANCNQQIKDTEQIITDLRNHLDQQSTAREQAEEKLRTLIEQKTKMEADLNQAQGQINEIIGKITQINESLISQIALIDDIVLEIDDTTGESVETHFKDISDNIQSIIDSLDNPGNQPPSNQPPGNQQKGNQAPRDKYRPVDPSKIGFTYKGGKSRKVKKINKRKTNKKHKHRGGYVYKPVSNELKKSSSVILSGVSDSGIITGTSIKKSKKRY